MSGAVLAVSVKEEPFQEARRELRGLTAGVEKKALLWMAARVPGWVTPDHLTGLGLLAMLLAGIAYRFSAETPALLHGVNLALAVNWLGDSLDGTLARFRERCRPRYGFYVDHLVDAFGALFLLGGLALSGYMSERIALALLIAYFLVSINIYLATYTLGVFKISFGPVGGTELRLLLALGNLALLVQPRFTLLGREFLLYDAVGVMAIAGLIVVLIVTTARNTRTLYQLERV
jgi:phosphatidylglycerophosphate synthase